MAQSFSNPLRPGSARQNNRQNGGGSDPTGAPPLHLLLQIGSEQTRTVALRLSERIRVGRGGEGQGDAPELDLARFEAAELGVSRLHAAILYQEKELFVEDLDSTNGTRINGLSITPNTPVRLRNGDELEFGSLRMTVKLVNKPG